MARTIVLDGFRQWHCCVVEGWNDTGMVSWIGGAEGDVATSGTRHLLGHQPYFKSMFLTYVNHRLEQMRLSPVSTGSRQHE